jgi:hypothetical protein
VTIVNKSSLDRYYLPELGLFTVLGKPLTNDEQIAHFLNIVEVYQHNSVHIYVEHKIDEPEIVEEVLLLPLLVHILMSHMMMITMDMGMIQKMLKMLDMGMTHKMLRGMLDMGMKQKLLRML